MPQRGATNKDVLKEAIIFATAIVVAVGAWIAIDKINFGRREQALIAERIAREREMERRRDRDERIRRDADEQRRRRAEIAAGEAKKIADRAAAETERVNRMKMERRRQEIYDGLMKAFKDGNLQYWRSASEEERTMRASGNVTYACLLLRPVVGDLVVEVTFSPSNVVQCAILSRTAEKCEISRDEFNRQVGDLPCFAMRMKNGIPVNSNVYVSFPGGRDVELFDLPEGKEDFSPIDVEFGSVANRIRQGFFSRQQNISYMVFFHENGRDDGQPICEVDFCGSVSSAVLYDYVEHLLYDRKARQDVRAKPKVTVKTTKRMGTSGLANHSTMSRTDIGGNYTPGEFHGTTVSYVDFFPGNRRHGGIRHVHSRSRDGDHSAPHGKGGCDPRQGHRSQHVEQPNLWTKIRPVRPLPNYSWSGSHYINRDYFGYYPKTYTHWKENAYLLRQSEKDSDAKEIEPVRDDVKESELIKVDRNEVEQVMAVSKISFKVVE